MSQPTRPSAEAVAAHELTHLLFEPWCKFCVEARGKEEAHRKVGERIDAAQPTIAVDYFFLSGKKVKGQPAEAAPTGIVAIDTATGALWATMVIGKGTTFGIYPTLSLTAWLKELGHTKVTFQSDGEPAIVSLVDAVRDKLSSEFNFQAGQVERAAVQHSPVDSTAPVGLAPSPTLSTVCRSSGAKRTRLMMKSC